MNFQIVGALGIGLVSLNLIAAVLYELTGWPRIFEWLEEIYE